MQNIRQLRERLGFVREDFAIEIGRSIESIKLYESGEEPGRATQQALLEIEAMADAVDFLREKGLWGERQDRQLATMMAQEKGWRASVHVIAGTNLLREVAEIFSLRASPSRDEAMKADERFPTVRVRLARDVWRLPGGTDFHARSSCTFVWVINECPVCQKRHYLGAAIMTTDETEGRKQARGWLGLRCVCQGRHFILEDSGDPTMSELPYEWIKEDELKATQRRKGDSMKGRY
jgi:transcriptional regulator with XRE-family HTH domain